MSRAILTASGHDFDLQIANPGVVMMADIAHALAQINRFTGHARRPYSVAEHSLLVLEIVERLFSADVHARTAALMHDAHEAYCGDLNTPAKALVGEHWHHLENRLERTVRSAFALHGPAYEFAGLIKQADLIALATERAQLMPRSPALWACLVHVEPVRWVDLMAPERCAMGWGDWRDQFMTAYEALDFARNDKLFPVRQP